MARPKTILFIGRLDPDTGYDACVQLCKKRGWKLIVNQPQRIRSVDAVFTTGYLGIIEAWSQGQVVLVCAANPLKRDYLLMHPMGKHLVFDADKLPPKLPDEPYRWAKAQTWDKVADLYERLWRK